MCESYYSVVQLSKGLRGERLNIGVITIDEDNLNVYTEWVSSFKRIAEYYLYAISPLCERMDRNIDWLKTLDIQEMRSLINDAPSNCGPYTEIHFTPWRASIIPGDLLLESIKKYYLD